MSILLVLMLSSKNADFSHTILSQDTDGDTALHCAVLAQKNESVAILLGAGADPTRVNFRLFTPIHEAARVGFLP